MNAIELAEKCGALTILFNVGGSSRFSTLFEEAQLQDFYEAAVQQGRDEKQLEYSQMEPVAYEYLHGKYWRSDYAWNGCLATTRRNLIIQPQTPINKEGS
jgi:hypothetical protein